MPTPEETPEADHLEQLQERDGSPVEESRPSSSDEVPEADALEQAREVPNDEPDPEDDL